MLLSVRSRIVHGHSDSGTSAEFQSPAPDQPEPGNNQEKPADEETPHSTLGENWPPNLHSHETDWVVIPEAEPTKDADRPMM
jgi:hypothetical protein